MTIGIDTNVLLRLFVDDGSGQRAAAIGVVATAGDEAIVLSPLVVAEFVRVLRRHFNRPLDEVVGLIDRLLEAPEFQVLDRAAIEEAVAVYRLGGSEFSDCLIVAAARGAGATEVYTFDRDAARRIPGATLLSTQGG